MNDKAHGEMIFTYSNKDRFTGTFIEGRKCGFGRYEYFGNSTKKVVYEG